MPLKSSRSRLFRWPTKHEVRSLKPLSDAMLVSKMQSQFPIIDRLAVPETGKQMLRSKFASLMSSFAAQQENGAAKGFVKSQRHDGFSCIA